MSWLFAISAVGLTGLGVLNRYFVERATELKEGRDGPVFGLVVLFTAAAVVLRYNGF